MQLILKIKIENDADIQWYGGYFEDNVHTGVGLILSVAFPVAGVIFSGVDAALHYIEDNNYAGIWSLAADLVLYKIPAPLRSYIIGLLGAVDDIVGKATNQRTLQIGDRVIQLRPWKVDKYEPAAELFFKSNLNCIFDNNHNFKFMSQGRRILGGCGTPETGGY